MNCRRCGIIAPGYIPNILEDFFPLEENGMGPLIPRPARSILAGRNVRTRVLTNLVKNMQVLAEEGGDPGQTTGAKRVAQAPEVASHLVDSRLDFALLTNHPLAQI